MTVQKKAQQYGMLSHLREKLNLPVPRSKIYKEHLRKMREVDDKLREDFLSSRDSVKRSIKKARRLHKEGRFLEMMHQLAHADRMGERIKKVADELLSFRDKELQEFYLSTTNLSKDELQDLHQKYTKAVASMHVMHKKAVWPFLSERERDRRELDRVYKERLKREKKAAQDLIDKADVFWGDVVSSLKTLKSYRIRNQLQEYVNELRSIVKKAEQFDAFFRSTYNDHFKKYVSEAVDQKPPAQPQPAAQPAAQSAGGPVEQQSATQGQVTVPVQPPAKTPAPAGQQQGDGPAQQGAPKEVDTTHSGQTPTDDFNQSQKTEHKGPEEKGAEARQEISLLISKAKDSYVRGNLEAATGYVLRASAVSDEIGDADSSIRYLAFAQRLIDD